MKLIQKWTVFLLGHLIVSYGIVLTIRAELGVAPWDVFHIGLTNQFSLTVGRAGQVTGFVIILLSFVVGKIKPTLGTIANMLLIGFMIDGLMLVVSSPTNLIIRYLYLGLGVIILGFGVGLYISAHCGTGPRDSLMMALDRNLSCDISIVRGGIEVTALSVGYLLGGPVGIGTILVALGVGPVVSYSLTKINELKNRFRPKVDCYN
ncbi:membrane protein [Natroniella sulfidigena]|uniref:YczE/YyaS/YitT family protein n=1 Tax=Natroniella sulfidigena TaxID=723921 RepID=UPI00200B97EC|nr:membrane protein [Natroniella sulfidigena]MCK8815986.1 membrane protein [Natroniella sulfidigena]